MTKGETYVIEVRSAAFSPRLAIVGMELPTGTFIQPEAFGKGNASASAVVSAKETKDYEIIVSPLTFGFGSAPDNGKLEYTLTVKPLPRPILEVTDKWTQQDPVYGERKTHFKAYPLKMKAGETYIIDLVRKAKDFSVDPYLFLEDPAKKVVARDDDSGGNLNARMIYTPSADGEFRIIATTLSPATGDFTLTVRGPAAKE
jgi:hypothetical protein